MLWRPRLRTTPSAPGSPPSTRAPTAGEEPIGERSVRSLAVVRVSWLSSMRVRTSYYLFCNRPGAKFRARDEAHERTETIGGGSADEVQSTDRGFKARGQPRISAHSRDRTKQLGCEEMIT